MQVQEAGFPDGVVNIICGDGAGAGTPLVQHPLVDKVRVTPLSRDRLVRVRVCYEKKKSRISHNFFFAGLLHRFSTHRQANPAHGIRYREACHPRARGQQPTHSVCVGGYSEHARNGA